MIFAVLAGGGMLSALGLLLVEPMVRRWLEPSSSGGVSRHSRS